MRLIGNIDGIEVRFDFYPPNIFKAEIPKQLDGTYILQLHAIDEAGNITNYSDIFVRIDFKQLNIEVLPSNYNFIGDSMDMGVVALDKNFTFKNISSDFNFMMHNSNYSYRELVAE